MNTIALQQAANYLTRHVQRWERRRRVLASVVWGPRALIVGLLVGIGIALIARMRPWLLAETTALYAVLACGAALVLMLSVVWLWPRPLPRSAQHFDVRFGLKERVSTALELTRGALSAPGQLGDLQLRDAVGAADQVNLRTVLPLRVRWGELLIMVVLVALLAYLLLAPNPKTDELLTQRALQNAIDAQIEDIESAIERIENTPSLSEEERQALTDPLHDAREILQQQDVSPQEAVAAMAGAQQALGELSDGMTPDQEAAYQDAASEFAGSPVTSDLAEALDKPDLAQTASALEQAADDLGAQDMTQTERDALAERFERAADRLEADNPALAQKLREAAQALRDGDVEAAQDALREAADLLRQQQEQLQNSEMAQIAEETSQQLREGQQEIVQTGRDEASMPPPGIPPEGGQAVQQPGEMAGQDAQDAQLPGEESGEAAGDQAESPGEGGENQGGQPGEGIPEGGEPSASEQDGGVPGMAGGQAQAQPPIGASGPSGEAESGSNAPSAGEGEGGAGADTVSGDTAEGAQAGALPGNTTAAGGLQDYDPAHAASTLGGESDAVIDVGGEGDVPGEGPLQEGEFGPNPEGESLLTYSSVFRDFRDIVSSALESGRIPLDQRDVIHDYFSSLNQ